MKRLITVILAASAFCALSILVARFLIAGNVPFRWFVEFKCLGDREDKIVAGRNGWLYFKPELEFLAKGAKSGNLSSMTEFSRRLGSRGITLFIVPVPHKLDLYPENLGFVPSFRPVNPYRARFIEALKDSGVQVIDMLPDFEREKIRVAIYDPFDSHWTPKAIQIAAGIIASRIDTSLAARSIPRKTRYTVRDTQLLCLGDLRAKLDQDTSQWWYPLPVGRVQDSCGELYRDRGKQAVLIIGDSYTDRARNHGSHLGAHLSNCLQSPTRTYSSLLSNTDGPCLYERNPGLFPQNGIVIWVLASRVLGYEMCRPKQPVAAAGFGTN